jgi:hypothetical protein
VEALNMRCIKILPAVLVIKLGDRDVTVSSICGALQVRYARNTEKDKCL